jgi:hypothetical protein
LHIRLTGPSNSASDVVKRTVIQFYEDELHLLIRNHRSEERHQRRDASASTAQSDITAVSLNRPPKRAQEIPSYVAKRGKPLQLYPDSPVHLTTSSSRQSPFKSPSFFSTPATTATLPRTTICSSNQDTTMRPNLICKSDSDDRSDSLSDIIGQHLRNQHSKCMCPIAYLPPLSLLRPHVCPAPVRESNLVEQYLLKLTRGSPVSLQDKCSLTKLACSKLSIAKRISADDLQFEPITCYFENPLSLLIGGRKRGRSVIGRVNVDTKKVDMLPGDIPHELRSVSHAQKNPHCFVANSGSGSNGPQAVTLCNTSHSKRHSFSLPKVWSGIINSSASLVLLNELNDAARSCFHVVDATTFETVFSAEVPFHNRSNAEVKHGCSMSFGVNCREDLLITDRSLWDIRQSQPVHRFDYLSTNCQSAFHPHGNSVIIGNQVWDLRSSKDMLLYLSGFENYHAKFTLDGSAVFSVNRETVTPELVILDGFGFKYIDHHVEIGGHLTDFAVSDRPCDFAAVMSRSVSVYSSSAHGEAAIVESDDDEEWLSSDGEDNSDDDSEDDLPSHVIFQDGENPFSDEDDEFSSDDDDDDDDDGDDDDDDDDDDSDDE